MLNTLNVYFTEKKDWMPILLKKNECLILREKNECIFYWEKKIECIFWCKKDTSSRVSEEENNSVYSKMLFRSFSVEIWQVFRK